MTFADRTVLAGTIVLALAMLVGLVVRRKVGVCRSFVLYLSAATAADILILLWPATFFTYWFWFGKELLINVLRFGVAFELTYRTFRAFPGAQETARTASLLILGGSLAIVLVSAGSLPAPGEGSAFRPLISHLQPRILYGTTWLLTAIAGLILWYRLPVHPWHKAILIGLVPYLLAYTASLTWIDSHGWATARESANHVMRGAYVLLLVHWSVAAWRGADERVEPARERKTSAPSLDRVTG